VHALVPEHGSRRRYGLGFWAVALTFLALGAFTTVPSPLYALYQARDGLSEFEVTVIYAAYAIGVIGALALAGHLSDWYGRRRMLIPAAGFTIASAIVFLTWKGLPGLLLARVLSGISFVGRVVDRHGVLGGARCPSPPGGLRHPRGAHRDDREHGRARCRRARCRAARAVGR
jgi:MFS family permease